MFRLFLYALLLVVFIETRAEDLTRVARSEKFRLCGKRLPEMLRTICRSKYYGKRSAEYDIPAVDYEYNEIPDAEEYSGYPFRTRMEAFSIIPHRFRQGREQKRGIVDECCMRSCSFDELFSYCE